MSNINCKFDSTEPVLETGYAVAFHTLDTRPEGWQALAFVVIATKATTIDVMYEEKQKDAALILYETEYVDLIWDGIQFNFNIESILMSNCLAKNRK